MMNILKFNPDDLYDGLKKELMNIEKKCFHPDIQEDWKGKQKLIRASASCFFAYDKNKIIGEAYTETEYEIHDDSDDNLHMASVMEVCHKEHGVYFYSLAVVPKYEGLGIAKSLWLQIIADTKNQGYKMIFSHAKEGSSSHLCEVFGGKFITQRRNWFGTGNTHNLYEIKV